MQTRFVVYDRLGAERGQLPNPLEAIWVPPLNSVPTLTIHYALTDVKSDFLNDSPEVAFEYWDPAQSAWIEPYNARLKYFEEDFDHLEDTPTKMYTFLGIGEVLLGQTVYERYGRDINSEGRVQFKTTNAGEIMKTVWDNAQTRGWTGFSYDFTATHDSNGQAWDQTFNISYETSSNLAHILDGLVRQGACDYVWEGRTLHLYNAHTYMARDKTLGDTPVLFNLSGGPAGVDGAPELVNTENLATHVIVEGENNLRWVFATGAVLPEGRREVVLSYSGVNDEATARILADPVILKSVSPLLNTTRQFHLTDDTKIKPLHDYRIGDWCLIERESEYQRLRIMSMSLWVNQNGVHGYVTLGDKIDDALNKMYQRIQSLTGGKANEGVGAPPMPKNRTPSLATDILTSADTYPGPGGQPRGLVAVSLAHNFLDTLGDPINLDHFEVQMKEVVVAPETRAWHVAARIYAPETSGTISDVDIYDIAGNIKQYDFRVFTISDEGRRSGASATVRLTMVEDTTPPPVPSTPAARTSGTTFTIESDGLGSVGELMPADYSTSHVEMGTSETGPWESVGRITGRGSLTIGVDGYYTRWFRMKSEDTTGNQSDYSGVVSATTVQLVSDAEFDSTVARLDTDIGANTAATQEARDRAEKAILDAHNSGEVWSTPDEPPMGTAYKWTGVPHESTSEQFLDAVKLYTSLPTNPSFESALGNLTVRTNMATNPSFETSSGTVEVRRNRVTNPSLEVDISGYKGSASVLAHETALAYLGTKSLKMTNTVDGNRSGSTTIPVTVGKVYTLSAYLRHDSSVNRDVRIDYAFEDSAGARVGVYNNGTAVSAAPNTWPRPSVTTIAAPTGATVVRMYLVGLSMLATETLWADAVLGEESPRLDPYFDGATAAAGDFTYSWTNTAHLSAAIQTAPAAQTASGGGSLAYQSKYHVTSGVYSLAVRATGTTSDSYAMIGASPFALGMAAGKTYTVSATITTPTALVGTLSARARKIVFFYRKPDGSYVETQSLAGPSVGAARLIVTVAVPADATEAFFRLYNGSTTYGDTVYWDDVILTETPSAGPYFDGTSTPETLNYSLGRPITNSAGNTVNQSTVTDGSLNTAYYYSMGAGLTWVQVDLGRVIEIDRVSVWHYYADGRTYYDTKTEISADGTNWTTVFDSAVSGTYQETSAGKTHNFTKQPVRYIRDWANGSTSNTSSHWVEIRSFDTVSDFTYAFTGASHASSSVQQGLKPVTVTGQASASIQSANWASSGSFSIRNIPYSSAAASFPGGSTGLAYGMVAGNTYTALVKLHLISAQSGTLSDYARRLCVFDGGTLIARTDQAPNAVGEHELRLTFTIPAGATNAYIVLYNGSSETEAWWDDLAVIEGTYTGPYFDGDVDDDREKDLWIHDTGTGKRYYTWDSANLAWVTSPDQQALDEANAALIAAQNAQTTADGKTTVSPNAPTDADLANKPANALWTQVVSGKAVGAWYKAAADATVWTEMPFDPVMIPQINIGTGTFGELDGVRLKAKSIGVRELIVADYENYAHGGNFDYATDLSANWTAGVQATVVGSGVTAPHTGIGSLQVTSIAAETMTINRRADIPVTSGERWKITFWVKMSSTWDGTATSRLSLADQASVQQASMGLGPLATDWTERTLEFVIPAGMTLMKPFFEFDHRNGTVWIDTFKVRRMSAGQLIVDGDVKARHVDTNSLTADTGFISNLKANSMVADIFEGKAFTGGTFTGTTFQSHAEALTGIKLTSAGLTAYDTTGAESFKVSSATGSGRFAGRVSTSLGSAAGTTLLPASESSDGTTSGLFISKDGTLAGGVTAGAWVAKVTSTSPEMLYLRGHENGHVEVLTGFLYVRGAGTRVGNFANWAIGDNTSNGSNYVPNFMIQPASGSGYLRLVNAPTTSAGANALIATTPEGVFYRSTSSLRYKADVQDYVPASAILQLRPRTWVDRNPIDPADPYKRYFGYIAEEVELIRPQAVVYNDLGEADAVQYDRLPSPDTILVLQDFDRRLKALEGV